MKLAIFGSRTLEDKQSKQIIRTAILEFLNSYDIEYLLAPGGLRGACSVAEEIAKETGIPIKLFYYLKDKGHLGAISSIEKRTKKIVEEADYFLCFHDGISKGTLWDIKQIIKQGKQYQYFRIEKQGYSDIAIEDIEEIGEYEL